MYYTRLPIINNDGNQVTRSPMVLVVVCLVLTAGSLLIPALVIGATVIGIGAVVIGFFIAGFTAILMCVCTCGFGVVVMNGIRYGFLPSRYFPEPDTFLSKARR